MDMRMQYLEMRSKERGERIDRERRRLKILCAIFLGICLAYLALCGAFCVGALLG